MTDLKSISPVRKLTVEDFINVAKACDLPLKLDGDSHYRITSTFIMQRYESLTSRVLCKEMFLGDKAWLKGFEAGEVGHISWCENDNLIELLFTIHGVKLWLNGTYVGILIHTVVDFITELDRYNRTASNPIKLEWTENFINEWVND